ncbi:hypothetical protein AX16_006236 [Volvariella volvacea WC 439]|nr:hypothetical protein AX16_006236 [Volvariella volvacea WC 439]
MSSSSETPAINHPQAVKWVSEMYEVVDRRDLSVFDLFYADDVEVNFANLPTLVNKKDILAQFGYLFKACEKMQHVVGTVYATNDQILISSIVKYRFLSGAETEVRAFTVCHKKPEDVKATRLEIYGDFGEVLRLIGEVYANSVH